MGKRRVLCGAMTLFSLFAALSVPGTNLGTATEQPDSASDPGSDLQVAGVDAGWWSVVQRRIREAEYSVTWQEETYLPDVPAAYQAPNRAHNLRTYFTAAGPVVIPRVWPEGADSPPWRWEAGLIAWGREHALVPVSLAAVDVHENRIEYRRDGLIEWYRNGEQGLEQGFTLMAPPQEGPPDAPLRLDLHLGGNLSARPAGGRSEIAFYTGAGEMVLRYSSLRVTDAAGELLRAWLSLQESTLSLLIDDASAVYPLQVDPTIAGLPTGYDWVHTGGGATGQFGFSLATAGDVNGDGYSDVIVGAPYYDGGQTDEGRAEVYPGWVSGLVHFPFWYKESDQTEARYGWSVATAGDVNGDGYADIIVGAPWWNDTSNPKEDEGGAWIYHGSSGGPHSAPDNYDRGNQAYAEFGYSVATAGDVNGDGYADVIVGAPYYNAGQTNEGRVWVWHGSWDGGVSASHNWRAESNQPYAALGCSVSTAGDVNGDGYADVIVGACDYRNEWFDEEGIALVWHGSEDGVNEDVNGDPTNADWLVDSDQAGASLGFSVSTAGDVNGDGYADVIVGSPYYSHGQNSEGAAWVYHGSTTGLSTAYANMDEGDQAGAWFGYSVATAGDVNGDGYADIIVGAPHYTSDSDREGRAWVWHGSPSGVSTSRDWYADGEHERAWFGSAVATAGDVNGDGYSDIVVGAPGDLSKWGTAYAYYGSPASVAETAGWTKASDRHGVLFGYSVGTAGDVNGDGYADVIVGAPYYDAGDPLEGAAWVYHGRPGGLNLAPDLYKAGGKAYATFGWSVGTAGDVNGDGYSDVIVGAPGWNAGLANEGMVFVYEGGLSGLAPLPGWSKASGYEGAQFGTSVGTAGDVNGDGYSDVIVGAPFYTDDGHAFVYMGSDTGLKLAPAWNDDCDQADSEYGHSVGTAGDVNRDGYSDIIVGAPKWDRGQNNEGGAFVYLGSRLGLAPDWVWERQSNMIGAQFGYSVGTAGDVDGDGHSDVIVGAPYATNGQSSEGRVWVYEGTSSGVETTSYLWRKELDQTGAQFGWSVGTAGDVNGDGFADIIVGANLWNGGESGELNEGGAWVYHGWASGPRAAPDWHAEGNQASAHFGTSVGTAGDVNGDGYADVIVGAPLYTRVITEEGQAFVYFGNDGPGASLTLYQFTAAGLPIAHLGHSDTYRFMVGMTYRNPFGRGRVIREIEAKPLGVRFNGRDTFWQGGGWYNYVPNTSTTRVGPTLVAQTPYHWRVREVYDPATTPWMPASRWVTIPWNGWQEQDLRTGGKRVDLPLVLREHN